jgi:hypothetical protein
MLCSTYRMNASQPKRNTWFSEEYIFLRFLGLLDSTDQLEFPVCVEHRDQLSPDFVLSSRNTQIGLEVTCSTDEELIRAHQILKCNPAPFIDVTGLKDTGRRRSNDALAKTMFNHDAPWEGENDLWDHKLAKIAQATDRKRKKFQSQDFKKFHENWLLIYDDYSRFTSRDSVRYFTVGLSQRLRHSSHEFKRLYIFCGGFVYRWRKGELSLKRTRR